MEAVSTRLATSTWPLDEKLCYRPVSDLLGLDLTLAIDLLMAETVPDSVREAVEGKGVPLRRHTPLWARIRQSLVDIEWMVDRGGETAEARPRPELSGSIAPA